MLADLRQFEEIIAPFADSGPPAGWGEWDTHQVQVAVPAGPISHW